MCEAGSVISVRAGAGRTGGERGRIRQQDCSSYGFQIQAQSFGRLTRVRDLLGVTTRTGQVVKAQFLSY